MPNVCWYFHLHQPWRLRPYSVFDVGRKQEYFTVPYELDFSNLRVIEKVAHKSYRPMLQLLLHLLQTQPTFTFSLSITGVFLEQLQAAAPDVIELLGECIKTGRVEILGETYYHSLASLYHEQEFFAQVDQHRQLIRSLFGVTTTVFRNTELVYTNHIAYLAKQMGFVGMLAEGADRILRGRKPTRPFRASLGEPFPLLLKHYQLSDDVAFRFSQKSWVGWPLTAETYAHWLSSPYGWNEYINLFMDFETFGEHQWEEHGIFPFFEKLTQLLHTHEHVRFVTPSQAFAEQESLDSLEVFDAVDPVSWADTDRDLTAWVGNELQADTLRVLYGLSEQILASEDAALIEDWRRLQTSDHFYYMCTKWADDGDVHAYFSPYRSPYEAYNNFNTVLADLKSRVQEDEGKRLQLRRGQGDTTSDALKSLSTQTAAIL